MSTYEDNEQWENPNALEDEQPTYMAPPEEEPVEPEQPEEQEQEQPVEQEAKPKKKSNIGQRLSEVQREKFQALDENRRLREEVERLKGVADTSTRTALNHYDDAVNQRLNAAKEKKRKALESGDIDAQTNADVELGMATAEYQEANRLKAQQQMYEQQQQPYQQNPYQQQEQIPPYHDPNAMYFAQEFVNENPWYDSRNEDYDQEMAYAMNHIVNGFDQNLRAAGLGNHIQRSPEYFATLRERAQELANYKRQLGGDLNMRQTRSPVAPVRQGGFSSQNQSSKKMGLSAEEKEIARGMGLKDEQYLQYLEKEIRETPWKRQWNGVRR